MKKVLLGILVGFMFIGCTAKLETDIKPYVTMHKNEIQKVQVNFIGVNDKRETKITSTILDKDVIEKQYSLSNDVKIWYTNAITRELKNTKMYGTANSKVSVEVNIKKIKATYKKYSLDKKNMQANISLELVINKDDTIIKSNINIKQTTYKPMILDAEGFSSILNESMIDSVSKTVEILIKKI